MYIQKHGVLEKTGQLVTCHRIIKLEIIASQGIVLASVGSYVTPEAQQYAYMHEAAWPLFEFDGNPFMVIAQKLIEPEGLCEGGVIIQDFTTELEIAQARKWVSIKASRDYVMYGGCTTSLGRIDTTSVSQIKLANAALEASQAKAAGNTTWSKEWDMYDNTSKVFNADEILLLQATLTYFVDLCQANGRRLRNLNNSATTPEEVDEINEGTGWPDSEAVLVIPEPEPAPEPESEVEDE